MAGALLLTNAGDFSDFGTTESATASTATLDGTQLTNVVLGDMLVALVHDQTASATATTAPTNWVRVGGANDAANVRQTGMYYYLCDTTAKVTAVAANHVWTFSGGGRVSGSACRATGISLTSPVDAAAAAFTSGSAVSSIAAAAVTPTGTNSLLVGVSHRQNSASTTNNLISSFGSMATHERRTTTSTAISSTGTVVAWEALTSSGSTGTRTVTYPASVSAIAAELVAFNVGAWQGAATAATTAAITATAARSDAGAVTAATTAAITATASTAISAAATATTTAAVTVTANTSSPTSAAPAVTAAITATATVAGATFVLGTAVERNSTTNTFTVPAGVTSSMVGLFVMGTASAADNGSVLAKSGATFTSLDSRAAGNMYVNVIKGTGLVAGDTITLSQTATGSAYIQHPYQDQYDFVPSSLSAAIRGSSVATCTTGAVTPSAGQRVVVISLERTTATGTTVSSVTATGSETVTQDVYSETAGGTAVSVYLGNFNASAAASRSATVTYNSASTNGYAATILTAPFVGVAYATAPTTAAVTAVAGTVVASASPSITAAITATAGIAVTGAVTAAGTAAITATANVSSPAWVYPLGYASVTALLADSPNVRIAHRGGSLDWPEMSFYAYQQSVNRGVKALEVSLARTSDGVWFGLHDATLDRTSGLTAGTNLDPSTLTWATIQATYSISAALPSGQTAKPYMRLDEVVQAFGRTHVLFLDPKNDTANIADLLDQLKALYDGADATTAAHVIIKMYGVSSTAVPNACAARGIKTWGYFFETDSANFAVYHARWDTLGLDYTATSGSWATFVGYGQPLYGHIIPSAAALTTALGFGANGAVVSGVLEAVPQVGVITAAVTATAARSDAAASTASSTAAVTATAVRSDAAAATTAITAGIVASAIASAPGTGAALLATVTAVVVAANVSSPTSATAATVAGLTATAIRSNAASTAATTTAALLATANTSSPASSDSVLVAALSGTANVSSPASVLATTLAAITAIASTADLLAEYHAGLLVDLAVRYHAGTPIEESHV